MPASFHDLLDDASSEDSDVGPGLCSEAHPPRECLMIELADHNTALPLPATASTPPDLTLAHTTRISLIHDSRISSQVDEKKFTLRYSWHTKNTSCIARHSLFDQRNRHTSTILIRHGCAGRVMSITRAPCKHLLHPSSSVACHRGFPFSSWIHSYVGFVSWPNLTLNPITNLLLHHILRPFTWGPITYHNFKSDEPNNHFNKNQPSFLFCLKPAQC